LETDVCGTVVQTFVETVRALTGRVGGQLQQGTAASPGLVFGPEHEFGTQTRATLVGVHTYRFELGPCRTVTRQTRDDAELESAHDPPLTTCHGQILVRVGLDALAGPYVTGHVFRTFTTCDQRVVCGHSDER